MIEPATTLDARFSDPGAVATEWEETRRVLETAELFWIATVRADGRPHVTPLVAVWLEDAHLLLTGATEQKAVNLSQQPARDSDDRLQPVGQRVDVVVEGDAVRSRTMTCSNASPRRGPEMGRTMAIRGAQRRLPPQRWRCGPRVLGHAHQDPRVREGHLQPHLTPFLRFWR